MISIPPMPRLIKFLEDSWIQGVSKDYKEGRLWNGEFCITSSLSFHLRKNMSEEWTCPHIWYECSFRRLKGLRTGRIDMIIADFDESKNDPNPDYWSEHATLIIEKGLMMAIEVKYAKRNYGSDFRKLSKLQKMTDYPIIPVFAYVGYTTKNGDVSSQYKHLLNLAKQHNSILLFGDPHKTGDWTVDNFTNVQGVM